jgi:hypothetical protein
MRDNRRPVLIVVACALALAAVVGFALGFNQSDRKSASGEEAPIAANLPANVVITDAQPLPPPPPPPPPKPKAPDEAAASDQAASGLAPQPPVEAPPPAPPPGPPSLPGGPLPPDLPPP